MKNLNINTFSITQVITYIFVFLITLLYVFLYSSEYVFYHALNISTRIESSNVIDLFASNMPIITSLIRPIAVFFAIIFSISIIFTWLIPKIQSNHIIQKIVKYTLSDSPKFSKISIILYLITIQLFLLVISYQAGAEHGRKNANQTYTKVVNNENMHTIMHEGKEIDVYTVNCNITICVALTKISQNQIQSIIYDTKSYQRNIDIIWAQEEK